MPDADFDIEEPAFPLPADFVDPVFPCDDFPTAALLLFPAAPCCPFCFCFLSWPCPLLEFCCFAIFPACFRPLRAPPVIFVPDLALPGDLDKGDFPVDDLTPGDLVVEPLAVEDLPAGDLAWLAGVFVLAEVVFPD